MFEQIKSKYDESTNYTFVSCYAVFDDVVYFVHFRPDSQYIRVSVVTENVPKTDDVIEQRSKTSWSIN